jgi:DNA-directed RNA polymerase specialized sigma24 family protein
VIATLSTSFLRWESDARLAARSGRGSERAFAAIAARHGPEVRRCCRRVLPDRVAEEAVEETFRRAREELRAGREVDHLGAWLHRLARAAALDAARRAGYDRAELVRALELAPATDEELERRAVIRETLRSVAALPVQRRETLLRATAEPPAG